MSEDINPNRTPPEAGAAPASGPHDTVHTTDDAVVQAVRSKLHKQLVERLPGGLPTRLHSKLEENLPGMQKLAVEVWKGTGEFLGPLWAEARVLLRSFTHQLAANTVINSVGGTFRHLCFVGLNRSELLMSGDIQPAFNENWTDLVGESLKRNTALFFFAPRGLDGQPANPYLFLSGESIPDDDEHADPNVIALAQQLVGPMALIDLCRISKSEPNTVNLLLVADTLFHWDTKDNYVLPTTATSWVRDVEQVLKSYPRTTRAYLYTQWDTDILPPSDRVTVYSLRDLPLDDATWLNKPTFQERYGSHALFVGIVVAAATYAGLWYQGGQLQNLSDQLAMIEQQIPRGGQFSDLERAIAEQERMWRKRELFPLVTKDTARAIERSGFLVKQFEVRSPEPEQPPKQYIISIDAQNDTYQGWLQQEPVARSLILNSALLEAVRKPNTTTGFKLEGLVDATELEREYKPFVSRLNKASLQSSPTQPNVVQPQEDTE